MAKVRIASSDLAWVFTQKLKEFDECNPHVAVAIIPSKGGWIAVTDKKQADKFPHCAKRVEQIQRELRKTYVLNNR